LAPIDAKFRVADGTSVSKKTNRNMGMLEMIEGAAAIAGDIGSVKSLVGETLVQFLRT
jgi:hypothetical protein